MVAEVYILDGVLNIQFNILSSFSKNCFFSEKIGKNLTDFTTVDTDVISNELDLLLDFAIQHKDKIKQKPVFLKEYINERSNNLFCNNPYVSCIVDDCVKYIYNGLLTPDERLLQKFRTLFSKTNPIDTLFFDYFDCVEKTEEDRYAYYVKHIPETESFNKFSKKYGTDNDNFYLYLVKEAFMWELLTHKREITSQLEYFFSSEITKSELTPLQKLFLIDLERKSKHLNPIFINSNLSTNIKPLYYEDASKLNDYIYTHKIDDVKDVVVAEVTEINNIFELFAYEMIKIATTNPKIKKCECCNHYFLIENKKASAKYCDRIVKGKNYTCSEVGAIKKHAKKDKAPEDVLYMKRYKHFHYLWQKADEIDMEDFYAWQNYAKKLCEKYKSGEISFDEFAESMNLEIDEIIENNS